MDHNHSNQTYSGKWWYSCISLYILTYSQQYNWNSIVTAAQWGKGFSSDALSEILQPQYGSDVNSGRWLGSMRKEQFRRRGGERRLPSQDLEIAASERWTDQRVQRIFTPTHQQQLHDTLLPVPRISPSQFSNFKNTLDVHLLFAPVCICYRD